MDKNQSCDQFDLTTHVTRDTVVGLGAATAATIDEQHERAYRPATTEISGDKSHLLHAEPEEPKAEHRQGEPHGRLR